MELGRLPTWLRLAGTLILAGVAGMFLLLLLGWLWLRTSAAGVAPELVLTASDLHLTSGEGVRTPAGIEVRGPAASGVAIVQGAIAGLDADAYDRLRLGLETEGSVPELRLIWMRADDPGVTHEISPSPDAAGGAEISLDEAPDWRGRIIAIGLVLIGQPERPALVERLVLEPSPLGLRRFLKRLSLAWHADEGWTGRSINFEYAGFRATRISLPLLVACWVGMSALLFGLMNPPWRGHRSPAPYALILLCGWLLLDARWQWVLGERLARTYAAVADAGDSGTRPPGPDADLDPFLSEIRRRLPESPARVFLVASDPGGYPAGRVRYHLLPHNSSLGRSELPPLAQVQAGDYLLLLSTETGIRFDAVRGRLIGRDGSLSVERLYRLPGQGALFRIQGGH